MQENFLSGVGRMHEAIIGEEVSVAVLDDLEADFGGYETVRQIHEVQERKAIIMEHLRSDLQQLSESNTVGIEGKMREVEYDAVAGSLHYFAKGGQKCLVSHGQLMVSGMWGESYYLDESVPYDIKKRYLVQKARYELSDLFDYQIALYEGAQRYNEGGVDAAYQAIAARYQEGYKPEVGELAEKMVESFLTKLSLDCHLPYRLKSVSVYEDVEYKIDFIIEPVEEEKEVVGLGVIESHNRPEIGIQFTTAKSELTVAHKKRQLSSAQSRIEREGELKLKDLVLVVLPIDEVSPVYEAWNTSKNNRRLPGGPDELWSEETKETVFRGILDKVFDAQIVDEMWQNIGKQ